MKLTFDELNLLVKTLSEKQNELETQKNIMQKQEQEKCEDDWSFHPSTELTNTKDAYYALSRLVEKIKNNIRVDCKCKLNKIYQATISVEYTLSRKVSNSSSGL